MGKESEHLQKQHVHESPKVMLIPAAILSGLCIVWGLSMPFVLDFMSKSVITLTLTNLGISLISSLTGIETPIFLALLVPTGLIAYYSYYKGFEGVRNIAAGKNPISTMLTHAFFFDDLYGAVTKGIERFSEVLTRIENSFFASYPDSVASAISQSAEPGKATSLKEGPSSSFRNYVAAAVLGFILIVVLIILTAGIGV
jgi:NADH:ubiquinone oxidoreductase subunit 5 (subunit L)/multisubunit Na+/H+ antiporter MnhA subunit